MVLRRRMILVKVILDKCLKWTAMGSWKRRKYQNPVPHRRGKTRRYMYVLALTYSTNIQVVAFQDWPEIMKYAGLVCAQAHRQELIQELFKTWQDPVRGTISGGMIKELLISF
ncbi:hypothetical protein J1N35_041218 [Gossypium stocksii]|uniref:Uncharacterized protein n=1 Tax=Gossypium stocksii TaxID=47602 RepID=A0A9D3ZIG7_9ROSI|nr:hypothetical protein J1N35_041218 [Gossypium stocksii]